MKPLLATALLSALMVVSSHAVVIAEFNFEGNSLNSSDAGTNWTTSVLTTGGGVPLDFDASVGNPAPSISLTAGHINDGTLEDDDYYSFTVTPDAGQEFDLANFKIDINNVSAGEILQIHLWASMGEMAGIIATADVTVTNTWGTYELILSELPTLTSVSEFRLYFETGETSASNEIKLDNLTLNDSTAVPEPSSMALLVLGACGLLIRRKRA